MNMPKIIKGHKWLLPMVVVFIIFATLSGSIGIMSVVQDSGIVSVGLGQKTVTIGNEVYAAGTADYTCDGVNDNVQFQAALDALPAGGGELVVLVGNYSFGATVTRAIDNVSIIGTGQSTYFANDGVTPLFTAGGNAWKFMDVRTDAGSINMGATTEWMWTNVDDGTYYAYRSPYGQSIMNDVTVASLTDSGLTSGRVPIAGAGGLLDDDADLTFTGGDTLNSTNADITTTLGIGDIDVTDSGADDRLLIDTYAIPRAATYVVAANDAPAHVKAQADYICDGTADQSEIGAALAALPANGGIIKLSMGTFTFSAKIADIEASNISIVGQGEATLLDFSGFSISYPIKVVGAITATNSALTVSASTGDLTVTVANGALFDVDDWVRIRSEGAFNGGAQHYGEIRKVKSVAGNVLTLYEALAFDYATGDTATVDLLTIRENVYLARFRVISNNANNNYGIWLQQVANVRIEDLTIEDYADRAIELRDTVGAIVTGCDISRSNKDGVGYGVAIDNSSRDITVNDNHFSDCRHAITCAGDTTYGVQTNMVWQNNTAEYSVRHVQQFGTHNTYNGLVIANNSVIDDGLCQVNGLNTVIIGNYNVSTTASCIAVYGTANRTLIDGNYCKADGDWKVLSISESSNLQVINNYFEATGSEPSINARAGGSNYLFDNNIIKQTGTERGVFLATDSASNNAQRITFSENNISASHHIALYIEPDNAKRIEYLNIVGNTLYSATDVAVQLNTGGLVSEYCQYVIISNNIAEAQDYGIYLYSVNQALVNNNMILNATTGVWVRNADYGVNNYALRDNKFSGCTTNINDQEKEAGAAVGNDGFLGLGETYTFVTVVNYNDSSPVVVSSVLDGYGVIDVWVEIVTTFDGAGLTLDIGDGGAVGGFLPNASINDGVAGYYGVNFDERGAYLWDAVNGHPITKVYTGSDTIDCTITNGGGTQGEALVYVKVTRIGG